MFDILLFDLDDTLLDFHKAEEVAFKKACLAKNIVWNVSFYNRYKEINEGYWKLLENGETTVSQLVIFRFADLFKEYHILVDPKVFNDCYFSYLRLEHPFMPNALELLKLLHDKRLFIVTNGERSVQLSRIHDSGIDQYVEKVFISEDIGYEKPKLAFFKAVQNQIENFDKKKTIIIGDSLTSDMRGGYNFHIATCWYNPKHIKNKSGIHMDYEIDDLLNLLPIVYKQ